MILIMLFFFIRAEANHNLKARAYEDSWKKGDKDDHFLKNSFHGQPKLREIFKQYVGNIDVDESTRRFLFYYFVESSVNCSSQLLILWLNGGSGCSFVGFETFTETC